MASAQDEHIAFLERLTTQYQATLRQWSDINAGWARLWLSESARAKKTTDERIAYAAEREELLAERDALKAERDALIAERDGLAAEVRWYEDRDYDRDQAKRLRGIEPGMPARYRRLEVI